VWERHAFWVHDIERVGSGNGWESLTGAAVVKPAAGIGCNKMQVHVGVPALLVRLLVRVRRGAARLPHHQYVHHMAVVRQNPVQRSARLLLLHE
jgi:hypothetical protein